MSDDLDIRSGGAVAVDTVTLRAAAGGFRSLAAELDEVAHVVAAAAHLLSDVSDSAFGAAAYAIECVRRRIVSARDTADDMTESLLGAAAGYELVELRNERAAAEAAGDAAAAARIDARLEMLTRDHPHAADRATISAIVHGASWPGELARQAPGLLWWVTPGLHSVAVPLAWSAQQVVGAVGGGRVPPTSTLNGTPKPVVLTPIEPVGPAAGPRSLTDAAARVPGGTEARIRIERYTMADGSRQFAVYAAGTQTSDRNHREPFDMTSNVELYTRERSASYDATLAALEQAGAQPGDVVHAFGHSQGAMIVTHLAMEGGYETRTLVTFGSPIEGDVGDGTLSVALRHSDDPVTALAAGGHAGPVGAPGSFVAERTADASPGVHDLALPAHGIDAYAHTAQLLDASDDPRMVAVRHVFDELDAAASVDVTEYAAARAAVPTPQPGPPPLSPSSSGAG